MKNTALFILVCCAMILSFQANAQGPNAIVGQWYNTEKDAKIEISKEGDRFFGKVVWLQEPTENNKPKLDKNNSDKDKRNRPIMGMRLLDNFEHKNGAWENGVIYDPKNGKTYSCTIKMKNSKTLEVRGYIGVSFIGRTVEWTQAE